ncbi:MAG: hypothetical protein SGPRY_006473 [Prymnesium sp.]
MQDVQQHVREVQEVSIDDRIGRVSCKTKCVDSRRIKVNPSTQLKGDGVGRVDRPAVLGGKLVRSRTVAHESFALPDEAGVVAGLDHAARESYRRQDLVEGPLARRALLHSALLSAIVSQPPNPAHAAGMLPSAALPSGSWRPMGEFSLSHTPYPEPFTLYLARLMLNYDQSSAAWYDLVCDALPSWWTESERDKLLSQQVASFAASLSYRLSPSTTAHSAGERERASALWHSLLRAYGGQLEARQQIALLFCLLPPSSQPVAAMRTELEPTPGRAATATAVAYGVPPTSTLASASTPLPSIRSGEVDSSVFRAPRGLLPSSMLPVWDSTTNSFSLPGELANPDVMGNYLGSVSRSPLTKEIDLSSAIYGGFMVAGGCGCALTHLAVVPLDVVKTRIQTRPGVYSGFKNAFDSIRMEEGIGMLFQGAGATGVGYFAYGVCVYPLYELFKRYLFEVAGSELVLGARSPLVLLAGALATILTCFAITPFEAVRIRMVECPKYASGLVGALKRSIDEGGVLSLYDGLIPLLVRQVLFGMVKFLIFDTCADAIKAALPAGIADDIAVSLGISLLSGAIAGVTASVVSQPADVVLSRVAQGEGSSASVGKLPGKVNQLALLRSAAGEIQSKSGLSGFYRGIGSRCLWSSAIIAGQFFLYDLFKAALRLTSEDLTLFYDAFAASTVFNLGADDPLG